MVAFAEDRSWRVRYQLASSFVPLVAHFPTELLEELLFVFIKLIRDSEQEVKAPKISRLSFRTCQTFEADQRDRLEVQQLAKSVVLPNWFLNQVFLNIFYLAFLS